MNNFLEYLRVGAADLGRGTNVNVTIKPDMEAIGQAVADDMFEEIARARKEDRNATLIVPVGPIDGYPILAERLRREKISIRDAMFINMDEYLTADGGWIPLVHPLSFRAFMDRHFYALLEPRLSPREENRVFPDPLNPGQIQSLIRARGGVDACFGGIGINGHIAFNEPPEPGEKITDQEFARLPTRNLTLSRETRTINSVTVGGDVTIIPDRAVTVGMKEILESRRLRIYCNRPWQSAVVRRALHGPITSSCPASFMRQHTDVRLTIAEYVAAPPRIALR
jgi:glucosamine-6-phosphate deaminase